MVIGVIAPLFVKLIQAVREWVVPAVVTAAVAGAAQLAMHLPIPPHLQQPPL